jgi:hypothetical protein
MKRLTMPCALLFTAIALPSLPANLDPQNESLISESQPILQPGTLPAAGQGPLDRWSLPRSPADAPDAKRKSWISLGTGSLPILVAIEPDYPQKYGTNPGVLQVYFGHRR